MNTIQVQIIKEIIEKTHELTVWYLSKLKPYDPLKQFEVEGKKLNSFYWIAAHLAWSENILVNKGLGMEGHPAKWLNDFGFGSKGSENGPDYAEVKQVAKEVHIMAMKAIDALTDEDLEKENAHNWNIAGSNTIRGILYHRIRHEGTHIGQLGWLCALNGAETV